MPGVLVVQAPPYGDERRATTHIDQLAQHLDQCSALEQIPLVVLVDDSEFSARSIGNFLWVTFTRSNPSHDTYGVNASVRNKHWGCDAPLIIDARSKPHNAPELQTTPEAISAADEVIRRTPGLMKLGI